MQFSDKNIYISIQSHSVFKSNVLSLGFSNLLKGIARV